MTTQGLNDAVLFNKYIRLDEKACLLDDSKKTPLEAVLNAKRKIQALMVMPVSTEVAA
nr:tRNA (adenine-N(6)-)-methyltransferase-tRNA m6A37 methyltransferase [Moritella viscosa]SHO15869.1 tRNA (adenine-N(6)-)-methyltransferase-tRNA m6A37 methyltransferase [Moritella viscosa]SHO19233.1 tRNA (adenine-N(6)-)-methyltransferase-tRNA m6A37 methyltransferase [Moritella viscosa]